MSFESDSKISVSLKVKYGLPENPSDQKVSDWEKLVRQYINQGINREEAGRRAARETFRGFQTNFYASEADTIEALLRAAEQK